MTDGPPLIAWFLVCIVAEGGVAQLPVTPAPRAPVDGEWARLGHPCRIARDEWTLATEGRALRI